MFAYGIIASPLPYAAVVGFYAIYLLFVQFNDSYDSQFASDDQQRKQFILQEDSQHAPADIYFVEFSKEKKPSNDKQNFLENYSALIAVCSIDLHLTELWSAKPQLFHFSYSLFTRPPPSFS